MSGSGDSDRPTDEGGFPYSPLGLATVAGLVGVFVCAVWLGGCLAFWVWRHYQRRHRAGAVPSTDVSFLPSPIDGSTLTRNVSDTAHFSYSINSLAVEPAFHHTSLESILSEDVDKMNGDHS